ncbi:hypothetical protein [Streptomyces sp. NBC_01304]|uniref:hypothetical protein n=1 Tax=Streptomyces sp. NBC_01304 TaxID=2903818 RepID=UPI002E10499E|nr:hypothetical protein OG430_00075 [Streptomyces sp. NBC_01304]WSJ90882.1 hypothetical protein OG430_47435 [Streptomyces sp. NBC_01304]
MDPVLIALMGALAVWLLRVVHAWITGRAQIKVAEAGQQGLSERTRSLPPGSRLRERNSGWRVDIEVGTPKAQRGGDHG